MPSAVDAEPPAASHKSEKKSKKHKKRPREEADEEAVAAVREHKRSKSEAVPVASQPAEDPHETVAETRGDKKKKKKHKKSKDQTSDGADGAAPGEAAAPDGGDAGAETPPRAKKAKKEKKKARPAEGSDAAANGESQRQDEAEAGDDVTAEASEKKKKRSRRKSHVSDEAATEEPVQQHQVEAPLSPQGAAEGSEEEPGGDRMDVDAPTGQDGGPILRPPSAPANPEFPFYTQTVSLYVPLFPAGFDQPITKVAEQHLKPLLNHYSPLLRGVLLDYRHVTVAETPTRADPRAPPTDRTPALLECKDEYAVGFGWLTAEVYVFVPRRGAWMEGTVNLHSEGHLGVVCWGRFNASLEARRVPRGWRFVDVVQRAEDAKKARFRNAGKKAAAAEVATDDASSQANRPGGADGDDQEEEAAQETLENSLQQMHATGYWVDAEGRRVQGKLRFRIKNFDVGMSGDHGYISIEGTMLDDDAERALLAKEKERERARKARSTRGGGMLRREMRAVPKFSVTSFGPEEQDDDGSKKQPIHFPSRPGTPDD